MSSGSTYRELNDTRNVTRGLLSPSHESKQTLGSSLDALVAVEAEGRQSEDSNPGVVGDLIRLINIDEESTRLRNQAFDRPGCDFGKGIPLAA